MALPFSLHVSIRNPQLPGHLPTEDLYRNPQQKMSSLSNDL